MYDSELKLSGRTLVRPARRESRSMVGEPAEPSRGISWVAFLTPFGEIEKILCGYLARLQRGSLLMKFRRIFEIQKNKYR